MIVGIKAKSFKLTLNSNLEMEKNIWSKIYTLLKLTAAMSFIMGTLGIAANKETWTYELKSTTSRTTDPEKFDSNLQIERVSRGVYAISGEIKINFDIVEGDSNNIAVKSFRSTQGADDYKVLPFQVSEAHFFHILNTFYKNVIMDTMKECSDMPFFEDKFQPPLEKKTYKLNACQFSQDGLPNHLQDGLYKLLIIGTGDVEWEIDVRAEVTSSL